MSKKQEARTNFQAIANGDQMSPEKQMETLYNTLISVLFLILIFLICFFFLQSYYVQPAAPLIPIKTIQPSTQSRNQEEIKELDDLITEVKEHEKIVKQVLKDLDEKLADPLTGQIAQLRKTLPIEQKKSPTDQQLNDMQDEGKSATKEVTDIQQHEESEENPTKKQDVVLDSMIDFNNNDTHVQKNETVLIGDLKQQEQDKVVLNQTNTNMEQKITSSVNDDTELVADQYEATSTLNPKSIDNNETNVTQQAFNSTSI